LNARSILLFLILVAAAGGSWYVASHFETGEITRTAPTGPTTGFYLRAARILGTDERGDLLYEIEADYAEQQANSDIELQNVQVRYVAGAEVPWTITADLATLTDDQETLHLEGHVVAISNEGFSGQVTEIRAPRLDIDPNTYKAETDGRVQLRIGERSLTGTGMLALLQDNRLELKSNVSGKFVP
jgi:LPS export ABC transporter protein LptC